MALALEGWKVIDADTQLTGAHDLWTSRAPAAHRDRVPHVAELSPAVPRQVPGGNATRLHRH